MAHAGPCRLVVPVGCGTCGTVVHVYLTVTPLPSPPGEVHFRTVADPDDRLMLELFGEAHRGPFAAVR